MKITKKQLKEIIREEAQSFYGSNIDNSLKKYAWRVDRDKAFQIINIMGDKLSASLGKQPLTPLDWRNPTFSMGMRGDSIIELFVEIESVDQRNQYERKIQKVIDELKRLKWVKKVTFDSEYYNSTIYIHI